MSYSSLYVIDKKFYGKKTVDFKNSWLFSPVVQNILSEKDLPKKFGGQYETEAKVSRDGGV